MANFIGVANLIPARVAGPGDGGTVALVAGDNRVPVVAGAWTARAGDAATVMIRPERLRVSTAPIPAGASIPVTVNTAIFQGPVVRLGLRAGDGTEIVAHMGPDSAIPDVRPGLALYAGWDKDAALLLPPAHMQPSPDTEAGATAVLAAKDT